MSETNNAWRCTVCGYVHRGPAPPDLCPVCGADRSDFELLAPAPAPQAPSPPASWKCPNCAYVHTGAAPPESCPVCGTASDQFESATGPEPDTPGQFSGRLIVVGAGIAGLAAVEAFRKHVSAGDVLLLSGEPELPYYRLNLTRLLAGEISEQDLPLHDAAWYTDNGVELRTAAETAAFQPENRLLVLEDGERLEYDRLILTVGAHPFIPPIAGVEKQGVVSLRTLGDARAMLERLKPGMKCVCIGGGLLGIETAGALSARGAEVTLLEGYDWLMPRQLNRRAGEILLEHIRRLGVNVCCGVQTECFLGDDQVTAVALGDGTVVAADLVVVATGVRPNTHLARRVGIEVNKGVVVDNHLRTSHPDIFAAGDVAEHCGLLYGSWAAAQYQGGIAGMNAAGLGVEFGGLPRSNTLKVLGLDLVSIGQFEPEDGSYTVLEEVCEAAYYRFVFHDSRLVGAVLVGNASAAPTARKHVEQRTDFSGQLRQSVPAHEFARAL